MGVCARQASMQRIRRTAFVTPLTKIPRHKLRPSFDETLGRGRTRAVIKAMGVWQMHEHAVKTMQVQAMASDAASAKHKEELATAVA